MADAEGVVRTLAGAIPVRHRYTPGVAGEAFLTSLRDRGVFLASTCDACSLTYVPARLYCERCFGELAADAEVGPEGTLVSSTVVHVDADGARRPRPLAAGLVRLDGATSALLHILLVDAGPPPALGTRVRAVFSPPDERKGSILDVRGFRVLAEDPDGRP
jgi:uncharacterized OB-fold protein